MEDLRLRARTIATAWTYRLPVPDVMSQETQSAPEGRRPKSVYGFVLCDKMRGGNAVEKTNTTSRRPRGDSIT